LYAAKRLAEIDKRIFCPHSKLKRCSQSLQIVSVSSARRCTDRSGKLAGVYLFVFDIRRREVASMGDETKQVVPGVLEKRIADVHLTEVRSLLSLQKLVEDLVREQSAPDQDEVDVDLQQQYRNELRQKLKLMPPREIAYIIESLEPNERLVVWNEVKEGADPILALLPDDVLEELIDDSHYRNEKTAVTAFELRDGQWVLLGAIGEDAPVCFPPFAAITFSLADLWV
jgi:hypothetical protein